MKLEHIISNILESKKTIDLLDRSAFIYLPPKGKKDEFAQCGTCIAFMPDRERCAWFGKDDHVIADASCALYVHGKPNNDQKIIGSVTPKQAGYVEAQVRCENCHYVKGQKCTLFEKLNKALPNIFKLDTKIEDKACCNAWVQYKP